jgi:eukaryotic-like serine/threonine-protein kinase
MADSDADLPRRIEIGDVLAGKYRIEDVLGEGGMGAVFRAVHVGLDQKVAVKSLLPQMARSEEHVARFTQEAKTLAKLQSEHVARVFDVGTHENGLPYMVLEYLEGCDLGALVDKRGPLPLDEAADLAIQVCAGLADVHAAGIIHRDLKPSNVYVVPKGDGQSVVKLLDFGISKFQGAAMTRTTAIMGSPGYMSPEQMRSTKDVDERADIWALGAILYELLTKRPAFVAENAPMLCLKIASDEPDPPSSARKDLPPGMEEIVLTCLHKDPERRYANVAEVAHALGPFTSKRMQGYVEKIESTLRQANYPLRSADAATAARNAHEQPTVRGGGAIAKETRLSAPDKQADDEAAARSAIGHAPTEPPAPIPTPLPILEPRRRSKSRMGIFVMGSILGAGVAIAYFGDVQKIRAQIESYVAPGARSAGAGAGEADGGLPTLASAQLVDAGAPPAAPAASTVELEILDAAFDDDGGDDDDDDDDDDDGGLVTSPDGGTSPLAKPAAPKKKPRPNHPSRPRRHRHRRR